MDPHHDDILDALKLRPLIFNRQQGEPLSSPAPAPDTLQSRGPHSQVGGLQGKQPFAGTLPTHKFNLLPSKYRTLSPPSQAPTLVDDSPSQGPTPISDRPRPSKRVPVNFSHTPHAKTPYSRKHLQSWAEHQPKRVPFATPETEAGTPVHAAVPQAAPQAAPEAAPEAPAPAPQQLTNSFQSPEAVPKPSMSWSPTWRPEMWIRLAKLCNEYKPDFSLDQELQVPQQIQHEFIWMSEDELRVRVRNLQQWSDNQTQALHANDSD